MPTSPHAYQLIWELMSWGDYCLLCSGSRGDVEIVYTVKKHRWEPACGSSGKEIVKCFSILGVDLKRK